MAEVGEDRETGHGDGVIAGPASVRILGRLEPVEGLDHRLLALNRSAFFLQPGQAVRLGTARPHFRADLFETRFAQVPAYALRP